jgi:hypothetical protein
MACAACTPSPPRFLGATSAAVAKTEAAWAATGASSRITLNAVPTTLDLAGTTVDIWAYTHVPAPVFSVNAGDRIEANPAEGVVGGHQHP